MLHIYPALPTDTAATPHKPIWIDLHRPTAEEEALVESEHGIRIPTHSQLQEIESSSRLRVEGQTLLMSMPLGLQDNRFASGPLPLGFVLNTDILITIRYCDIHAFPDVEATLTRDHAPRDSSAVFATLLEAMVDFAADRLEQISADLGAVSQRIFGSPAQPLPPRQRINSAMQQNLIGVGQTEPDHRLGGGGPATSPNTSGSTAISTAWPPSPCPSWCPSSGSNGASGGEGLPGPVDFATR